MRRKVGIGLVGLLALFLGYVASRPAHFEYQRSGFINASAEAIYPYLNNFKLGSAWSPFEHKDPKMKKTYAGPETGVGSKMVFQGNSDVGAGELEILKELPNQMVELSLQMTEPMNGKNMIQYTLTPDGTGTRFTWKMWGEGNFVSKLMGVLIDCDQMIGGEFEKGIANLKVLIESPH